MCLILDVRSKQYYYEKEEYKVWNITAPVVTCSELLDSEAS